MSKHDIPSGDRARCIMCGRGLYVFASSPWPECTGVRQFTHAGRPMNPVNPLTTPRPGVPEPVGIRERQTPPTGLSYRPVNPPLSVPLEDAA